MSAAFDIVNHEILLTRLHQHFGISDTALDWLKDYKARLLQPSLLWSPKYQVNKMQRVQNTAARLVTRSSRYDRITPL